MFLVTTALCPQKMRDYVSELVDQRLLDEYEKYKEEMFAQERMFVANREYVSKKLHHFIECSTRLDGGFNYLVKFRPCRYISELDFCQNLLRKTGIAVFTESSFALNRAMKDNYWVRISLAVPNERFQKCIDKLYVYLSELESQREQ